VDKSPPPLPEGGDYFSIYISHKKKLRSYD
jgi:hypothetical protein